MCGRLLATNALIELKVKGIIKMNQMKKGHTFREELPHPFMPGFSELVDLYYSAWDLARYHISVMDGLAAPFYMDEGFEHGKIWQWDSCFMAMFCRYAYDLFPGIESLDNFYSFQHDDGYIAMSCKIPSGDDSYPLEWGRINPPLFSWAEWECFKISGDSARLRRVFPALLKYDEWIERNRRRGDGSYWFEDGGASGMDNSPRTCRRNKKGNDVAFIDLAAQQTLSALRIADIASMLGEKTISDEFRRKHSERADYVNNNHWCERNSFYYDKLTEGMENERYPGYFSSCKTAASFWPMLAESVPAERVDALVAHLMDKNEFNRPNVVPTLSYDNPNYHEDGCYWQGSVWAPTNYMIVKGLEKCGKFELSMIVTEKYLYLLDRVKKKVSPNTLWECYSPEYDRPATTESGLLCRGDFVGWTGLGPIAMLIENMLGLDIDFPGRKIICRPYLLKEHGIDNLRFGPHRISLRVASRNSINDAPIVSVDMSCSAKVRYSYENGATMLHFNM